MSQQRIILNKDSIKFYDNNTSQEFTKIFSDTNDLLSIDSNVEIGGSLNVADGVKIRNDDVPNDEINVTTKLNSKVAVSIDSSDVTGSLNITMDTASPPLNVILTSTQLDNIIKSNLGDNSSSTLNNITMRCYNDDVDNSYHQIVPTFEGGDFLTLGNNTMTNFQVVSSDANDTLTGTGARQVTVHYVNVNNIKSTQTIDLNGTTTVTSSSFSAGDAYRFLYATVDSTGTGLSNAGNITIHETGDATKIYEIIPVGANISASSKMYIPANKTFVNRTLSYNYSSDTKEEFDIKIEAKPGESSYWYTLFHLMQDTDTSTGEWSPLVELKPKDLNDSSDNSGGLDIRITAYKAVGSGRSHICMFWSAMYK